MSASYRPATPEDAPAIDRVFRTAFCDTFAHLYRREDLQSFLSAFTQAAWTKEIDDPEYGFRVAEVGSEVVGYVKLGPQALPVRASGPALELRQIYILKDWHGMGIARTLMDWAIAEARRRGAAELYLTVFKDNRRAWRLYEQYGFEIVGPYAFMVGDHADEDTIMRLTL